MVTKELKLNPLLIAYNGNNYTQTGLKNVQNMREILMLIIFFTLVKTLIKLNILGMKLMGDMNWHAHVGIRTYPIQAAVRYNIHLCFGVSMEDQMLVVCLVTMIL